MAINIQKEGICAAHVTRGTAVRPVVELLAFYPADTLPAEGLLERLVKELHVARYQCTTLLGSGEYQMLSVDAPNVPPNELKTAIRWRLKDMLDFHVDDATIDVLDVPVDKSAPTRNHSMYAVAARNNLVQQRQAFFEQARIPLRAIDIPEMAQRNFSALVEPEGRGIGFLSFDDKGGLLTITFSGELYLSRRIDLPLSQLQHLDPGQLESCYEGIALELQRSLDHFDRQYHFIAVSKVVLLPLGPVGDDLRAYLAANLYVPVELFDLESVLNISKAPELKQPASQQRYFMTLGAALRVEEKAL